MLNFPNDLHQQPLTDVVDRTSALISWSYAADRNALRLIDFFNEIDHFQRLDEDDRFLLVKYNIFPLYPILKCFHYNQTNHCCTDGNNEEVLKYRRFYQLCFGVDSLHHSFRNLIVSIVHVTEQDPIILSLLLIILMFYDGLSMNEDKPLFKDGKKYS